MKKENFGRFLPILLILGAVTLFSCGSGAAGETGTEIIKAKEALALVTDGAILVDAQKGTSYDKGHITGAVNISRADIVVNTPVANTLAPAKQIEEVLGSRGITRDSHVVIYDNNENMDSARLWWTMKLYGHEKVQVVSGGLNALARAGASYDKDKVEAMPMVYRADAPKTDWVATAQEIRSWIDNPEGDLCIIDTRTDEEYNEGTIPGSVHLNFAGNNFGDGTYRPVQQIQIRYLEKEIGFDSTAVMYCKTSIRAAQTFLALYDSGYRNLKIYDGAWLDWTQNPMNPVFVPDTSVKLLDSSDQS